MIARATAEFIIIFVWEIVQSVIPLLLVSVMTDEQLQARFLQICARPFQSPQLAPLTHAKQQELIHGHDANRAFVTICQAK